MPCSDSSSSIAFKIDHEDRFVAFDFAKITCGREITAETGFSEFCQGRTLQEIIDLTFSQIVKSLKIYEEEKQFILYLEWDSLRATIANYLGLNNEDIDQDRCQITSIEHEAEGIEVALVILPPKELPKTLPCSLADNN